MAGVPRSNDERSSVRFFMGVREKRKEQTDGEGKILPETA
jgi:hypothetical protein